MSGAPAEIEIVATDDASDVFQDVSSNFTDMSNNVSEASDAMSSDVTQSMQLSADSTNSATASIQTDASQMQDSFAQAADSAQMSMNQITVSTGQVSTATDVSSQSFGKSAMQMNTMAVSGAMLYMSINNIENSEVSLSRAHLIEEKAANDVTLAQQAYNKAVAEYGPMSLQAVDAQNKLALAEQTQSVDQERVAEAQRNFNSTLIMSAVMALPSMMSAATAASSAMTAFGLTGGFATSMIDGVNIALYMLATNPVAIAVIAVTALAAIIYELYEHCAPFRDAINDIGTVLRAVFVAAFEEAMAPIKAFEAAINDVAKIVKPLEGFIGDLGSALSHLCFAHAAPAAEEFNKQITQSLALSDQLAHKTNTLGYSLQGLAGNVNVKGGSGTSNVTIGAPTIQIGSLSGSASLKQTRDAVSKGICDAMYKKGLMNKVM